MILSERSASTAASLKQWWSQPGPLRSAQNPTVPTETAQRTPSQLYLPTVTLTNNRGEEAEPPPLTKASKRPITPSGRSAAPQSITARGSTRGQMAYELPTTPMGVQYDTQPVVNRPTVGFA